MCPVVKITHRLIEPRVQHQGTPRDLGLQPKSHPIRSDLRSSKPFGPPDLRNSSLSNPDKDLDEKAASKIAKYRELYRDHRRQLDFVPAIASTSGRIHSELLRLLFLHAHRETTRFFEIFDDKHAQPHTSRFTYRRAAFFNTLKNKTESLHCVAKRGALVYISCVHLRGSQRCPRPPDQDLTTAVYQLRGRGGATH